MREKDITVRNEGTIVQFFGESPQGCAILQPLQKEWLEKNLPTAYRLGRSYCVEHRFAEAILRGILEEGLVVERGME